MWPFHRHTPAQPRIKTDIGTFSFQDTAWVSDPDDDRPIITVPGEIFDLAALDLARALVQNLEQLLRQAIGYARAHGGDLVPADIDLVLDHLELTDLARNEFALEFSFSPRDDAMPDLLVTVDFKNGTPIRVWGSD